MRKGSIQKYISLMRYVNPPRSPQFYITSYTRLEFSLAQDFGGCQDRLIRDSDATMIMQP